MNNNDIISRLNATAANPQNGKVSETCYDAITIIAELVTALENATDALDAYSGGMASELEPLQKAIAAAA